VHGGSYGTPGLEHEGTMAEALQLRLWLPLRF
jgi:hypothetical protein